LHRTEKAAELPRRLRGSVSVFALCREVERVISPLKVVEHVPNMVDRKIVQIPIGSIEEIRRDSTHGRDVAKIGLHIDVGFRPLASISTKPSVLATSTLDFRTRVWVACYGRG
jgi:hypothetical protein